MRLLLLLLGRIVALARCGMLLQTEQRGLSVRPSVRLSVTTVSPAKAAEPIVILVGMFTSVAPRNHVLDYTDADIY